MRTIGWVAFLIANACFASDTLPSTITDSAPAHATEVKISPACHQLLIRARLKHGKISGDSVAFNEGGVFYKGNIFNKLEVEYNAELDTALYFPRGGRGQSDSEVLMPMYHGNGATYSHAGAKLNQVSLVSQRGFKNRQRNGVNGGKKRDPSLSNILQEDPNYRRIAAETIDMPFHGSGPHDEKYKGLDVSVSWMEAHLRQVRSFGPNKLCVPTARSGSAGLLVTTALKNPGLVHGMILISPVHPTIALQESLEFEEAERQKGVYIPNMPGFEWIVGLLYQMQDVWGNSENPFLDIPTLVLTGQDDLDVMPDIKAAYDRFTSLQRQRGIPSDYWDVAGAAHDVVALRPLNVAVGVWSRIFRFLHEVEMHREAQLSRGAR